MSDPHYETLGQRYCANCGFHLNTYFWAFTCTPDSPCRCCLQAAIGRVRELHRICTSLPVDEGGCGLVEHTEDDPEVCWECCVEWPCPTIHTLNGGGDE